MKAIRACAVLGVGSFVFAVACSSGGASSSCGAYFDKLVATLNQCGATGGLDASQRDAFIAYCDEINTAPGVNNFAGQVDACSQKIDPATCSVPNCSIRGTFTAGTACANGLQCDSGSCSVTGTANPTTELACGTCRPLAKEGDSCTSAACDTNLYCANSVCTAYVTAGNSCANGGECTPGLLCDAQSTCSTPPTKGQSCTEGCVPPYTCVGGTCIDRVGVGAACPNGNECLTSLNCNQSTQKCEAQPVAKSGEACGFVNNQYVPCDAGLVCAGDGVCAAPKQQGAACTVGNHECAANLICANGSCVVPDFSTCK